VRYLSVCSGIEAASKAWEPIGWEPVALVQPEDRMAVRRLTPRECERLQGFPDDHTLIPWRNKPADQCPDGPRYKALGNSMAVPCMAWIGKRIARVENERQGVV
jgi:site-specific DNA-cytosine methylase